MEAGWALHMLRVKAARPRHILQINAGWTGEPRPARPSTCYIRPARPDTCCESRPVGPSTFYGFRRAGPSACCGSSNATAQGHTLRDKDGWTRSVLWVNINAPSTCYGAAAPIFMSQDGLGLACFTGRLGPARVTGQSWMRRGDTCEASLPHHMGQHQLTSASCSRHWARHMSCVEQHMPGVQTMLAQHMLLINTVGPAHVAGRDQWHPAHRSTPAGPACCKVKARCAQHMSWRHR